MDMNGAYVSVARADLEERKGGKDVKKTLSQVAW